MRVDARHHWVRRNLAPRETRIGILIFFAALLAAAPLDFGETEGSLATLLSQTFVVLAWVALWNPAYRLMTGASFRLARSYFDELADAEISRSKWSRLVQLADVVTAWSTSLVAGSTKWAANVFEQGIVPMLRSDYGCKGGRGLKIHPDFRYGNLYHWLLGD